MSGEGGIWYQCRRNNTSGAPGGGFHIRRNQKKLRQKYRNREYKEYETLPRAHFLMYDDRGNLAYRIP